MHWAEGWRGRWERWRSGVSPRPHVVVVVMVVMDMVDMVVDVFIVHVLFIILVVLSGMVVTVVFTKVLTV